MKTEKLLAFGLIAYALTQRKPPRVVPPPSPKVPYQPNNAASYQAWLAWTQQVLRQAQAAYGSFEKAYQALWGPGGIFYKEPLPKYDAGSLFWQEATAGLAGVGRIYKTAPPGKNLCADGTYSDLSGRGVCSRHGGVFLKKAKSRAAASEERKQQIENQKQAASSGKVRLRFIKDPENWSFHATQTEKKAISQMLKKGMKSACSSKNKCYEIIERNGNLIKVLVSDYEVRTAGAKPQWYRSTLVFEILQ